MTLLEATLAALILAVGVLAIFGMMHRIDTANRSVAFQRLSLEILAQISAQIRDARCEWDPTGTSFMGTKTDAGIQDAMGTAWRETPIGGSVIETLGLRQNVVPKVHVSYRAALDVDGEPAIDFEVRIREVMNDPDKDAPNLESGYWIQIFPVKKLCNTQAHANARGEY